MLPHTLLLASLPPSFHKTKHYKGLPTGSVPDWEKELQEELMGLDDGIPDDDLDDLNLDDMDAAGDGWEDELATMLDEAELEALK